VIVPGASIGELRTQDAKSMGSEKGIPLDNKDMPPKLAFEQDDWNPCIGGNCCTPITCDTDSQSATRLESEKVVTQEPISIDDCGPDGNCCTSITCDTGSRKATSLGSEKVVTQEPVNTDACGPNGLNCTSPLGDKQVETPQQADEGLKLCGPLGCISTNALNEHIGSLIQKTQKPMGMKSEL